MSSTLLALCYRLQTHLAAVFCTFSTFLSQFHYNIGMPNGSCILELRANQCLVCNFLCMPRCKCQIAPKKTQSLSCFRRNFSNMLTPFQVVSDSNSKVFGRLTLFQCLLLLQTVKICIKTLFLTFSLHPIT